MQIKPLKIKRITRVKKKTPVHDITVKDNGNFFAHGVLVHNCPFACRYCHPSGTKIRMADGTQKNVERVQEGDRVLTYNTQTGGVEEGVVEDPQHRYGAPYLIEIKAGDKTLRLTPEHPVWVRRDGKAPEWVDAGVVKWRDEVIEYMDGTLLWTYVHNVEVIKKKSKVYNFETGKNHTYFANDIVVHNCFADAFRASLYTAFFDNGRSMGLRHCNPTYYKTELDKIFTDRGKEPHDITNPVRKAVAMEIPMRMGIRFEDFTYAERKKGVSLEMIKYLKENAYPIMLNTKSDVVGDDPYVKALSENKAGAAVHVTLISSNAEILKKIEPGAPDFDKRLGACKKLVDAGVRVVARIEPFLPFVTDHPDDVKEYIEKVWATGIRNITFDTYSYSARNPGIKAAFVGQGFDFERIFLAGCDSQALGSLLLDKFMDLFRAKGFSCSTFDMGCTPRNDQKICCEVHDHFEGGWNYGCTVMAARFILDRGETPSTWDDYEKYVDCNGGFLSDKLRAEVYALWNGQGNNAYSHNWAAGIEPYGADDDGIIWVHRKGKDHRKELLSNLTGV